MKFFMVASNIISSCVFLAQSVTQTISQETKINSGHKVDCVSLRVTPLERKAGRFLTLSK